MRLNQRGNFERIMAAYQHKYSIPKVVNGKKVINKKTGKPVMVVGDMPRVTESDLVLLFPLTGAGTNLLQFNILDNQPPIQPEEIRLNQNDEFTVCEVGIFLYGTSTAAGGAVSRKIWTYAPTELSGTFNAIDDFWLGVFSVQINKVTWVENWFVDKHRVINETVTQNYGTATTGAQAAMWAHRDGHETGIIEMTPTVTMSGAKKYTINITLPYAIAAVNGTNFQDQTATANTFNISQSMILFRGFNAQNAADFQHTAKKKKRV